MKLTAIAVFACSCIALAAPAWAIPSSITYQGTLKQSGLPASGNKNMLFRITNQDGTKVYWSSGNMPVSIANGLFSAHISPTGVDWQNLVPYIEVSVEGQILLPREPVNATAYAMISNSIVDGAITPASVISGYGLVPSGGVVMFTTDCPSGWTRFSAMDNAFPMGSASYGATGGSATHTHTLGAPNDKGQGVVFTSGQGSGSTWENWGRADHSHSVSTASHLPPYVTMVFCQKQ